MTNKLATESYRTVAGTSLTGSYQDVGAVTATPAGTVLIINSCDETVIVSWDDGATDGFLLPALSAVSVDGFSNKDSEDEAPKLSSGSQFRAKHNGVVPTQGLISIMVVT